MAVKLTNNAKSTLAANIVTTDTTLAVQSGDAAKFPTLGAGDWCPLTVVDAAGNMEIMKVTARAGAVLTVARGQEGTTAKNFTAGANVSVRVTAASVAPALRLATTALDGLMVAADKAKLDGIAAQATKNATDATLLARANHTGEQAQSTITGLVAALAGKATATQGAKAETAVQPEDLATVATSGAYADLTGKPVVKPPSNKTIFLSSGTWTKPAGLVKAVVTVLAAGGGSSGCGTSNSTTGGVGAGGGASIKTILAADLGATETVTVGAGGTAGSGTGNGGAGGTSSFGAHCSASGGGGGTIPPTGGGKNGGGGTPGAGSGGDINLRGGISYADTGASLNSTDTRVYRPGGDGALGNPGARAQTSEGNGIAAEDNSGAGASGGWKPNATARSGAVGGSGLVIVEEYF
jgi:hypothetical protein